MGPGGVIQEASLLPPGASPEAMGENLQKFEDFLRNHKFYTVPVPFDFMKVDETLVAPNTPTWLDQFSKLPHRRAWAVLNTDPVAGNNVWVNTVAPQAAGQGGRVLAQGGSLSVPGSESMNIWVFTNVGAGVTVSFYQFA